MRTSRLVPALLVPLLALGACDRETPEQKNARREARRTACIAEELALQAKERLATLDTVLAVARGTPRETFTAALYTFAFAVQAHADAAAKAAVYTDSALQARSPEDSTRYAAVARQARPPAAPPGSVEANAATRFSEDMSAALGNLDHPCNKEGEEN